MLDRLGDALFDGGDAGARAARPARAGAVARRRRARELRLDLPFAEQGRRVAEEDRARAGRARRRPQAHDHPAGARWPAYKPTVGDARRRLAGGGVRVAEPDPRCRCARRSTRPTPPPTGSCARRERGAARGGRARACRRAAGAAGRRAGAPPFPDLSALAGAASSRLRGVGAARAGAPARRRAARAAARAARACSTGRSSGSSAAPSRRAPRCEDIPIDVTDSRVRASSHACRELPPELRLAGGAAAALVVLDGPALVPEVVRARGTGEFVQRNLSAFGVFTFVEAAILLVAAARAVPRLGALAAARRFHLPGGDGVVDHRWPAAGRCCCSSGGCSTSPTIGGATTTVGIQWGIFVALLAAGALVAAGARVRAAHRPEPPNPIAEETEWEVPERRPRERAGNGRPREHTAVTEVLRERPPRGRARRPSRRGGRSGRGRRRTPERIPPRRTSRRPTGSSDAPGASFVAVREQLRRAPPVSARVCVARCSSRRRRRPSGLHRGTARRRL